MTTGNPHDILKLIHELPDESYGEISVTLRDILKAFPDNSYEHKKLSMNIRFLDSDRDKLKCRAQNPPKLRKFAWRCQLQEDYTQLLHGLAHTERSATAAYRFVSDIHESWADATIQLANAEATIERYQQAGFYVATLAANLAFCRSIQNRIQEAVARADFELASMHLDVFKKHIDDFQADAAEWPQRLESLRKRISQLIANAEEHKTAYTTLQSQLLPERISPEPEMFTALNTIEQYGNILDLYASALEVWQESTAVDIMRAEVLVARLESLMIYVHGLIADVSIRMQLHFSARTSCRLKFEDAQKLYEAFEHTIQQNPLVHDLNQVLAIRKVVERLRGYEQQAKTSDRADWCGLEYSFQNLWVAFLDDLAQINDESFQITFSGIHRSQLAQDLFMELYLLEKAIHQLQSLAPELELASARHALTEGRQWLQDNPDAEAESISGQLEMVVPFLRHLRREADRICRQQRALAFG